MKNTWNVKKIFSKKEEEDETPPEYMKNRQALKMSKYFDYRGGMREHPELYPESAKEDPHGEAMRMAEEYVDERMPLFKRKSD